MAETWPLSLQQKLEVAGFQKVYGDTRVSSEMDVGPEKVRSRYTDAIDGYTCQITLDFADVDTWETFYKTQLGNGTLPFDFNDPFAEAPATFRFDPKESPSLRPLGGRKFTLSMKWQKVFA